MGPNPKKAGDVKATAQGGGNFPFDLLSKSSLDGLTFSAWHKAYPLMCIKKKKKQQPLSGKRKPLGQRTSTSLCCLMLLS